MNYKSISEKQKASIKEIICGLKHLEVKWMKDFLPDERIYIHWAIKNQSNNKASCIELNNDFTKFRKIILIK